MTPEAAVAGLAASLLAQEINRETLASLQSPKIVPLLIEIEPEIETLLEKDWDEHDFEDAAVEFCRLFILDPKAPARAAAFEDSNRPVVASRIQMMIDAGNLNLPERYQSLAPDHIAVLLLVFSSLKEEDGQAFKEENLFWLPQFIDRLLSSEEHVLYRLIAKSLEVIT